ncbi:dermonecrotic toxin domain-containing protein [Pseudomonas sp. EA_5y_Pfl2_R50]|uniref:dermonecrotic toxin domain-containing protein n=1 Tax=Pseudomonas sp. EA_5y_Pfl2_R50 TaxID=3088691 RepID=UPI0030D8C3BD
MFDELTRLPTDFGLVAPLLPNLDHNLLLSSTTRWSDCHDQWLDLMAQAPASALDEPWWTGRARGTPLTRKAHAISLYRQHFEVSSQWALADGTLSGEQFQALQALINPTAQANSKVSAQRLRLLGADQPSVELPGALVMTLGTSKSVPHLLYLPSSAVAWSCFQDRNALQDWLIRQQPQLLGQPRLESSGISVEYIAVDATPLTKGAEAMLAQLKRLPADRQRGETALSRPPTLPSIDSNEDFPPFAQLSPDIPLGLRLAALSRQQRALEDLLGSDFQGERSEPRLQRLKQQLDALATAEQACSAAATQLLNSDSDQHLLELRHRSNPHYTALYQARLQGLRAEADLQATLGQISGEEQRWLTSVLDAPDQPRPDDIVVARLLLAATVSEGNVSSTQTQELHGVLLFSHPSALLPASEQSVLLYWPGRFGGLQRFASRQALETTLLKISPDDKTHLLQILALSANPLEYGLQMQLYTCVEQASQILRANPVPSHTVQRSSALEALREQTLARLTLPGAPSRDLAYAHLVEQNHSAALASHLPSWLSALPDTGRQAIRHLLTAYLKAMTPSHQLLERELPPREEFSRKAIFAFLQQAFGLTRNVEVTLDIPDTTSWRKEVMTGAAPGSPQRNRLIASAQRSKLTLADLLQGNIDQAMWWRLSFMQVEVSGEVEAECQKVKNAITQPWLRTVVAEQDLAGKYEAQIRQAFFGPPGEATFSNEYRRECLSEPWRLMLKLQGEFAVLRGDIKADGQEILELAIDTGARSAETAKRRRIVLLPAHLSVGGVDTDGQGPSTLAGITFIEEQISQQTLLYLPDSPDGVFLRQFDSLEEARMALYNLCLQTAMPAYLAGRAVTGEFARHVSRINQALLKNFDTLIGTGKAWPAGTSLAAHLLNVHMGRLLQTHRATSRSNDALYLENVALQSGALFNYLKMALGMMPFIGSAIALYDAWDSANLAVAAFLRGDVGHGLAEVEAVLLSLIDAAMDVLPGVGAAGIHTAGRSSARGLTRLRQAQRLANSTASLVIITPQRARYSLERFRGYEYERSISLAGLQPGSEGIYRNVYRHSDGDFIISHGRVYRVELSQNPSQWRLSATSTRTYKQPIALDEAGQWNSHYAVYGTIFAGGGVGGGAVLGHMADGLDPLWPAAIRALLPRWWVDRQLRRQLTLNRSIDASTRRLDSQTRSSGQLLERYQQLTIAERKPLQAQVDAACATDIETAQSMYQHLGELWSLSHGRKRVQIEDLQSRCAWVVTDRTIQRINVSRARLLEYLNTIEELIAKSNAAPYNDTATHLALVTQRKEVRKQFLKEFDHLHASTEQANLWNSRVSNRRQRAAMSANMAALNEYLNEAAADYLKTSHTLQLITHYGAVDDPSWFYFQVQIKKARSKVGRALLTQHYLPDVQASLVQRNRVLEDCLETYTGFRRQLQAWTLGYPQHLDLQQIAPFLDDLGRMEAHARQAIKHRPAIKPKDAGSRQLFETEDNQWLIGTQSIDAVTRQTRFTIEGLDGYRETWLPRSGGKYLLHPEPTVATPVAQTNVKPLLNEARKRLANVTAYRSKVMGYARQDMLPVDLEHMLHSEALELSTRADTIEKLAPGDPLVLQLTAQAQELRTAGRALRIEQSLRSRTPTEGHLDYLMQQQAIDIRKDGGMRALGKRPDGRKDFLQEYEIRDLSSTAPRTLWYAHFHFTSDKAPFSDFVKAHLKLPEQRNLGLQWQQAQAAGGDEVEAIWRGDIGKPLGIRLFAVL